jgi:acetyl-CoA acetyltransferase family protein
VPDPAAIGVRPTAGSRALIASAVRSPVGRRRGALQDVHAGLLLGTVVAEALDRAGVPPAAVDQVLAGCVTQVGDQAYNVARMAWLTAGLPQTVPATTLDAQCGSSQQAVNLARALIRAGEANVVVAAGVELMSRHPLGSNVAPGPGEPQGAQYRERYEVTTQGEAAERIADRWAIGRAELDQLGARSQQLAVAAWEAGRFHAEVMPVDLPGEANGRVQLARDEGLRYSTPETLAALRPSFRPDGRHHAGNSSQISDGAAAVVLVSDAAARELGIEPLGEVVAGALVADDPVIKLTGPIPATRRILADTGLAIDDFDVIEVNEAFASVVAAWRRELGPDMDRVNVNGGAIAIGHPVGASGARLCTTALHELRRRGGGRALVTMCVGGGLGTASVLEVAG